MINDSACQQKRNPQIVIFLEVWEGLSANNFVFKNPYKYFNKLQKNPTLNQIIAGIFKINTTINNTTSHINHKLNIIAGLHSNFTYMAPTFLTPYLFLNAYDDIFALSS